MENYTMILRNAFEFPTYSNFGFGLLGHALAAATGKSME